MKPKPTPKKLPRARVSASMTNGLFSVRRNITAKNAIPVAVIPCHTAAQAKRIVKAAPFLQMTQHQQEQVVTMALIDSWSDGSFHDVARAVLRCMGLGGRGEK